MSKFVSIYQQVLRRRTSKEGIMITELSTSVVEISETSKQTLQLLQKMKAQDKETAVDRLKLLQQRIRKQPDV
jgi:hypothetical protein